MTLRERFQLWRIRPGLVFARKLAEQQAWKHPNANMMGPEANLMCFAREIGYRLTDADDRGKIEGLCLDATTPLARLRAKRT